MSPKAESLVANVLRLPRQERAFLAEKLLESLDEGETFEVSEAWHKEIRRRRRELDEGKVTAIPGDQVFDEITKELG
jgi:putative addiction module component (TIGR02574 family)